MELSSTLNAGMELLVSNELANLRSSEAEERELTPGGAAVRTEVLTAVLYRAVATCCAVVEAGAERGGVTRVCHAVDHALVRPRPLLRTLKSGVRKDPPRDLSHFP